MLTIGALALDATDIAATQPPHRPHRPARTANQGAATAGIFRQIGTEVARMGREAGKGFPLATYVYPR